MLRLLALLPALAAAREAPEEIARQAFCELAPQPCQPPTFELDAALGAETSVVSPGKVAGGSTRALLYGAGRVLRGAPPGAQTPETALRGHQLSYRSISNTYDAWSPDQMRAYMRDLALFGCNQIELVAPDGNPDAHFQLPQLNMSALMSAEAARLGLNVSLWLPQDASDPAWGEDVWAALPRLDMVFVPGGDPGDAPPADVLALMASRRDALAKYHPNARFWVSNQGFNSTFMADFFAALPGVADWLGGVVYGPHTRVTLLETQRAAHPVPVRAYPDVCHQLKSQFPAPAWSARFGFTEARETINPRPVAEAAMARRSNALTIGFSGYSDGATDDINKVVWLAVGVNASAAAEDVLAEYARLFISPAPEVAAAVTRVALALEQWAPVSSSDLELLGTFPHNWRAQSLIYRARYDAFQVAREQSEAAAERAARAALAAAPQTGAAQAVDAALQALASPAPVPGKPELEALALRLWESVRMQLSVAQPWGAASIGRGANLDTLEVPLSDAPWLQQQLGALQQAGNATLAAVAAIASRADPGPGGLYDALGDPRRSPHLVQGVGAELDPQFYATALRGFQEPYNVSTVPVQPLPYHSYAQSMYDAPLLVRYEAAELASSSTVAYAVKVVYSTSTSSNLMRLDALLPSGAAVEVHDWIAKPNPMAPLTFPLPAGARAADGSLVLRWLQPPGSGGNGRGCQVSEVLLVVVV